MHAPGFSQIICYKLHVCFARDIGCAVGIDEYLRRNYLNRVYLDSFEYLYTSICCYNSSYISACTVFNGIKTYARQTGVGTEIKIIGRLYDFHASYQFRCVKCKVFFFDRLHQGALSATLSVIILPKPYARYGYNYDYRNYYF